MSGRAGLNIPVRQQAAQVGGRGQAVPLGCRCRARRLFRSMASGCIRLPRAASARRYSTPSVLFGEASSAPAAGSAALTACCMAAA